jgi:ABC-type Mn2+/Zn2+ transport system ATPase subunit
MKQPIAHIHHLSVQKKHHLLLTDLSFTLFSPEILIIVGPNGAGKSTLLKCLANLIKYQGSITWAVNKINYVPHQSSFNRDYMPPMTVQEFFSFKQDCTDVIILKNFKSLSIPQEILHKPLLDLSTGEFQRILLAWSLVDDPDVLLLDEPSSGLDIAGEELLYSHLHKLCHERAMSIVLVTHNLNIAWKYAHRVLCLQKRIICIGSAQEALTMHHLETMYGKGNWLYEHLHSEHL